MHLNWSDWEGINVNTVNGRNMRLRFNTNLCCVLLIIKPLDRHHLAMNIHMSHSYNSNIQCLIPDIQWHWCNALNIGYEFSSIMPYCCGFSMQPGHFWLT